MRVENALKSVKPPHCFLVIRSDDGDYCGALFFDNEEFLNEVCDILRRFSARQSQKSAVSISPEIDRSALDPIPPLQGQAHRKRGQSSLLLCLL